MHCSLCDNIATFFEDGISGLWSVIILMSWQSCCDETSLVHGVSPMLLSMLLYLCSKLDRHFLTNMIGLRMVLSGNSYHHFFVVILHLVLLQILLFLGIVTLFHHKTSYTQLLLLVPLLCQICSGSICSMFFGLIYVSLCSSLHISAVAGKHLLG